ncbi:interleukin-6-like [Thalassophryne amazonica]|uniref:interleukin-6-like n=1 Tax=Thalassophryne amazonica TaxID=390379 RepID=UPI001470C6DB|nr:interleukin-6-like [Thalassophryne amazonica]
MKADCMDEETSSAARIQQQATNTRSSRSNMSLISVLLLSAVTFAALGGSPYDTPTDSQAGDPSGEEAERPPGLLSASPRWGSVITTIKNQKSELEKGFPNMRDYLLNDGVFTAPEGCPSKNVSMTNGLRGHRGQSFDSGPSFVQDSCLRRLVKGLQKYKVLLKHLETECSCKATLSSIDMLVPLITEKLENSTRVKPLSKAEKQQLLKEVNSHDVFQRTLSAYIILHHLCEFVIDGQRAIDKNERQAALSAFSDHRLL